MIWVALGIDGPVFLVAATLHVTFSLNGTYVRWSEERRH